jgi:hypothetical protein
MSADREITDYRRYPRITRLLPMPNPGGIGDCARCQSRLLCLAEWTNDRQALMSDFPQVLGVAAVVVDQGVLQC